MIMNHTLRQMLSPLLTADALMHLVSISIRRNRVDPKIGMLNLITVNLGLNQDCSRPAQAKKKILRNNLFSGLELCTREEISTEQKIIWEIGLMSSISMAK